MTTAVLWLRRDLRRRDLPALGAAADTGAVVPLFVLDPALWDSAGPVRRAWLAATLLSLRESYEGSLCLRVGPPEQVVAEACREAGAGSVHVSRETTPLGRRRDARVRDALAAQRAALVDTGTPYAVGPGLVVTGAGSPYQVFTPFARAWRARGWPAPAAEPRALRLTALPSDDDAWAVLADALAASPVALPDAGEDAAWQRWCQFRDGALTAYGTGRNRPDRDGSSGLSPDLKLGAIHPRSIIADLYAVGSPGAGAAKFVTELAWREFYADVLWHHPDSAWRDLRPALAGLEYDDPVDRAADIEAWKAGRTGYPIVDAGMRQLLSEGWMHNRVRMITASFFTKDLHLWWPLGARHFLDHLIDGDLASNSHGWQWVAGTGTDAAPYFRVFNPTLQGKRFDPAGDYVRRFVPELRHVPGAAVHEPWTVLGAYDGGYPEPIVEHAAERREALRRLSALSSL